MCPSPECVLARAMPWTLEPPLPEPSRPAGPGGVPPFVFLRGPARPPCWPRRGDRKSTRLNSSHSQISYAVFCLKKKKRGRPPSMAAHGEDARGPKHGGEEQQHVAAEGGALRPIGSQRLEQHAEPDQAKSDAARA